MKTKLLRKIRKKYEIFLIEDIGTNPNIWLECGEEHCGLPFYLLKIRNSITGWSYSKDIQVLKDKILVHVRKSYAHKIKRKPAKYKKVWHLSN